MTQWKLRKSVAVIYDYAKKRLNDSCCEKFGPKNQTCIGGELLTSNFEHERESALSVRLASAIKASTT